MLRNQVSENEKFPENKTTQEQNDSLESIPSLSSVFNMSVEELLTEIRKHRKDDRL